MSRSWRSAVKAWGRRCGVDIRRYTPEHSPSRRRSCILDAQRITLTLDVGGNVGGYGRELRDAGYRGRIISFEPQEAPFRELALAASADPLWECRQVALGEWDGTVEMHMAEESGVSSLLALEPALARTPGWSTVATRPVEQRRLDSFTRDLLAPDDRICLKLDVQGYELSVLRGAGQLLERISVVEAEQALVPLYRGQPDPRDLLETLAQAGFTLAAVAPGDFVAAAGRMVFFDAIFVRREPDEIPNLVEGLAWRSPVSPRGARPPSRGPSGRVHIQ